MKFVNLKTLIVILGVGLVFVIAQTDTVSAISVKELLGLEKPEADQTEVADESSDASNWAEATEKKAALNSQIDLDYVSLLIDNMNQSERERILADPELFKQVIENEANSLSAIAAAIGNNLIEDRNVEFLMRRGAESILRESYLTLLIASRLPKDFPNDEQVAEYYESNKAQFIVPERFHAWQIFFNKAKTNQEDAALKKKVEKIIADLKSGKEEFANIAFIQSEHEQSRALGGYMGLLKTNDLIPELKDPILKLKAGAISVAIESPDGIHILKRGKILEPEPLQLPKIEAQVRQLLINQANAQLRNAIFTQARKEYPQAISENKLDEWRLRLKTKTNSNPNP